MQKKKEKEKKNLSFKISNYKHEQRVESLERFNCSKKINIIQKGIKLFQKE